MSARALVCVCVGWGGQVLPPGDPQSAPGGMSPLCLPQLPAGTSPGPNHRGKRFSRRKPASLFLLQAAAAISPPQRVNSAALSLTVA